MGLELVDFTNEELDDFLFMIAPPRVPLSRMRLKLEFAIKQQWDEDMAEIKKQYPAWQTDADDNPVISPGSIYRVLFDKKWKEILNTPMRDITRRVHEVQNGRFANAVERNDHHDVYKQDLTLGQNLAEMQARFSEV